MEWSWELPVQRPQGGSELASAWDPNQGQFGERVLRLSSPCLSLVPVCLGASQGLSHGGSDSEPPTLSIEVWQWRRAGKSSKKAGEISGFLL